MLSGLEKALGARSEQMSEVNSHTAIVDKAARDFSAGARGLANANASKTQNKQLESEREVRKNKLAKRDSERKSVLKKKSERREQRREEIIEQKQLTLKARSAAITIQATVRGARARTQTREMLFDLHTSEKVFDEHSISNDPPENIVFGFLGKKRGSSKYIHLFCFS